MISFRPAPYTPGKLDIVEIWFNGKMVGAIYPDGDNGIVIKSQHVAQGPEGRTKTEYPFKFMQP